MTRHFFLVFTLLTAFLFPLQSYSSNPDIEALIKSAAELQNEGRYKEALEKINIAVNKEPSIWQLFYQKGHILQSLNKWDESEKSFSNAINLQKAAELYTARGNSRYKQGKYNEALSDYMSALDQYESKPGKDTSQYSPQEVDLYIKQIKVLLETNNYKKAKEIFSNAQTTNPGSKDIQFLEKLFSP